MVVSILQVGRVRLREVKGHVHDHHTARKNRAGNGTQVFVRPQPETYPTPGNSAIVSPSPNVVA